MKRVKFISILGFLILIDQVIKLYIKNVRMNDNFYILSEYVQFQPTVNVEYSWVNSLLDLGINRTIHIIVTALVCIFVYMIYRFISSTYKRGNMIDLAFILIFAGAICSLIDKLFWGGTLDYILLKGLFVFDLKDIYITMFGIISISMLIFNYQQLKSISNRKLVGDFMNFVKLGRKI